MNSNKFIGYSHLMLARFDYELDITIPKILKETERLARIYPTLFFNLVEVHGDSKFVVFSSEPAEEIEAEQWLEQHLDALRQG